jgi:hypothetical protein
VDVLALAAVLHLPTFPLLTFTNSKLLFDPGLSIFGLWCLPRLHGNCCRFAPFALYLPLGPESSRYLVPNSVLSIAGIDEFPTLICSTIAVVWLNGCILFRAASKRVGASRRIKVPDQSSVL